LPHLTTIVKVKKIASIVVISVGFVLFGLNYAQDDSVFSLSEDNQSKVEQKKALAKVESEEDESLDLSHINLPSIFSALFKLI